MYQAPQSDRSTGSLEVFFGSANTPNQFPWQLHQENVLLKRMSSLSQPFLVITRSVRPLSHRNQERSQMLPSVVKSEDRRTREARAPCSRVGS